MTSKQENLSRVQGTRGKEYKIINAAGESETDSMRKQNENEIVIPVIKIVETGETEKAKNVVRIEKPVKTRKISPRILKISEKFEKSLKQDKQSDTKIIEPGVKKKIDSFENMMSDSMVRRKKFEIKRKSRKISEVDEKDENVASMRMIIGQWKAQETNEKFENKNGQKQREKKKTEF